MTVSPRPAGAGRETLQQRLAAEYAAKVRPYKVRCLEGHALAPDNVVYTRTKTTIARMCRKCHNVARIEQRRRRRTTSLKPLQARASL